MEDYRFKVNLGGMIEILSDHLYSSPDVYIRELLQNGVDAITGRKKLQEGKRKKQEEPVQMEDRSCSSEGGNCSSEGESCTEYEVTGCITLEIDEGRSLIFSDNGQGLTEEEIHQFLAIIGESSKRNLENGRIETDYIGRFGIGLLSCFMVSDEIKMLTRSCKGTDAPVLEWRGKPDGTYTIRKVKQNDFKERESQGSVEAKRSVQEDSEMEYTESNFGVKGMQDYFDKRKMQDGPGTVSYTNIRAHETRHELV